jgi:hypothetical protein
VFPANDLVHPFEAADAATLGRGVVDRFLDGRPLDLEGRPLDRPDVAASLRRVCGFFGVAEPQVYVSALPGHAHAPGAVRIAARSLVELAADELEALLAHLCGHLVFPGVAGELSADRAAALYHGSADAITRVIFGESAEEFRIRERRAARTDRHDITVHSGPSADDPAVRVREIQAWTATPGFARLAARLG